MSEGADWLEQARRLVAGLGEAWTESADGAGQAGTDTAGHVPGGDCRYCPLCRAATVARRPEVNEALADLLTTAAGALRAMAEASPGEPHPPAGRPGETAAEQATGPAADPVPRAAPVQHIELG